MNSRTVRSLANGLMVILVVWFATGVLDSAFRGDILDALVRLLLCAGILWTLFAGQNWWHIVPVLMNFGGMLWFGFKLYLQEVAPFLAFPPLLLRIAVGDTTSLSPRRRLPPVAVLLFAYLAIHATLGIWRVWPDGTDAVFNVGRSYYSFLWPFMFVIPYAVLGRNDHTRQLRRTLYMCFLLVTLVAVGVGVLRGTEMMAIGNYVLPSVGATRLVALTLLPITLASMSLSRRLFWHNLHGALALFSFFAVFFGGGRTSAAGAIVVIGAWLAVMRRWAILGLAVVVTLIGIVTINLKSDVLRDVPHHFRRSFAAFAVSRSAQWLTSEVDASTDWHRRLNAAAFQKWTATPMHFLFGNRVEPYDDSFGSLRFSMERNVEIASGTGAYEAGLWVVLSTYGLTGLTLFLLLVREFGRGPIRCLLTRGIQHERDAMYFVMFAELLVWFGFCWWVGHQPNRLLVWLVIAWALWKDNDAETEGEGRVTQGTPGRS